MPYDIRFKTSFNCLVSGMSGSGKTTWVKNLLTLKTKLFTEVPAHVFLFYRKIQDIYIEMEETGLIFWVIHEMRILKTSTFYIYVVSRCISFA